jgi:hypothetical protein
MFLFTELEQILQFRILCLHCSTVDHESYEIVSLLYPIATAFFKIVSTLLYYRFYIVQNCVYIAILWILHRKKVVSALYYY